MSTSEPLSGHISFPRPVWRVVRCLFDALEGELRKRDRWYYLIAVTQAGDLYTLFWTLKEKPAGERRNGREIPHEQEERQ